MAGTLAECAFGEAEAYAPPDTESCRTYMLVAFVVPLFRMVMDSGLQLDGMVIPDTPSAVITCGVFNVAKRPLKLGQGAAFDNVQKAPLAAWA